jgi:hypothetical protein
MWRGLQHRHQRSSWKGLFEMFTSNLAFFKSALLQVYFTSNLLYFKYTLLQICFTFNLLYFKYTLLQICLGLNQFYFKSVYFKYVLLSIGFDLNMLYFISVIQYTDLNVITSGQLKSDNNKQIIPLSDFGNRPHRNKKYINYSIILVKKFLRI